MIAATPFQSHVSFYEMSPERGGHEKKKTKDSVIILRAVANIKIH
jgi:hypothetical protein